VCYVGIHGGKWLVLVIGSHSGRGQTIALKMFPQKYPVMVGRDGLFRFKGMDRVEALGDIKN